MRPNEELLQRIGQVRSKWKAFVWMRGLLWVLGLLVAARIRGRAWQPYAVTAGVYVALLAVDTSRVYFASSPRV